MVRLLVYAGAALDRRWLDRSATGKFRGSLFNSRHTAKSGSAGRVPRHHWRLRARHRSTASAPARDGALPVRGNSAASSSRESRQKEAVDRTMQPHGIALPAAERAPSVIIRVHQYRFREKPHCANCPAVALCASARTSKFPASSAPSNDDQGPPDDSKRVCPPERFGASSASGGACTARLLQNSASWVRTLCTT